MRCPWKSVDGKHTCDGEIVAIMYEREVFWSKEEGEWELRLRHDGNGEADILGNCSKNGERQGSIRIGVMGKTEVETTKLPDMRAPLPREVETAIRAQRRR